MEEKYFVAKGSVVREIWSKSDTVLFIFAGSAAEFALNKDVDWLYYTGRLPEDPIGRMFSTLAYAQGIVFADTETARTTIDAIVKIHSAVERNRGTTIPMEAYRDVLYMLIYYSIAAYECLERKLSLDEKEEVYNVFYRMALRMNITELPTNYQAWLPDRERHLQERLAYSICTKDLFVQYKKHLGAFRYLLLKMVQAAIVPQQVITLLHLTGFPFIRPILKFYKYSRWVHADTLIKSLLLPQQYKKAVSAIDRKKS